jgi:hypothetical protein
LFLGLAAGLPAGCTQADSSMCDAAYPESLLPLASAGFFTGSWFLKYGNTFKMLPEKVKNPSAQTLLKKQVKYFKNRGKL